MTGGIPGYMPPPMQGPINDTPSSGVPKSFTTDSGGGNPMSPIFNFHFNPGGGLSTPSLGGGPGPDFTGGGQGGSHMPPPPIRPINGQGGNPMQRPPGWSPQRLPPGRTPGYLPSPFTMPPTTQPPQGLPGWAGYLQWLQMMGGGGRMPPPPIGGI